ncbi:MAG: Glutamine amidotransferase subunit PdxT [Actinomycetota bacterium]
MSTTIGVLALQGAFAAHLELVSSLDIVGRPVRLPSDLEGLDGLILPGGESTTMSNLLRSFDLLGPVGEFISAGHPVFGTCAGMILLSDRILDGRADQIALKSIDIVVRRNGYGRQVDSFETDIDIDGFDSAFHAVFIRAPRIEEVGPAVEVLARHEGDPILVRQGTVMAASFHPELTNDDRIHRVFADMVRDASSSLENSRNQVR